MADERPQEVHIRAINTLQAHEMTHPLGWRMPCRTCGALQAAVDRATEACRAALGPVPRQEDV